MGKVTKGVDGLVWFKNPVFQSLVYFVFLADVANLYWRLYKWAFTTLRI
jgi:hypothetical protein